MRIRNLERSAGYVTAVISAITGVAAKTDAAIASYWFKTFLQYGYLGEKMRVKPFSKEPNAPVSTLIPGIFLRRLGPMKALAIGDFTVNMGQGLIQWQGLGYGKRAGDQCETAVSGLTTVSICRRIRFYIESVCYLPGGPLKSYSCLLLRNLNANRRWDPATGKGLVSSLLESGFNRTASEQADRNAVQQLSFGRSCRIQGQQGHWGLNGVQHVSPADAKSRRAV